MAIRTMLFGAVLGLCFGGVALAQAADHGTRDDNYSTQGNVNPYTGQPGTKPRDENSGGPSSWTAPTYGSQPPAPVYGDPYSTHNPTGGANPW